MKPPIAQQSMPAKERIGCGDCLNVSTPKGKSCYTMVRRLKEMVRDCGKPFIPEHVIPALNEIERSCSRYRTLHDDKSACPKCGADAELLNDIVDGDAVVTECSVCFYHFDDEDIH